MRNRHLPRLCHSCQAPMGAQEDACWRCGVSAAPDAWVVPPSAARLRVIDGGTAPLVPPEAAPVVSTAERLARLVAEARA
jgi:hypothetical protein